jgi:division protein CdvB (Snf7/Vps24/ESCRT-III family)
MMVAYMKGIMIVFEKDMVLENINGQMEHSILGFGKMMLQLDMVNWFIQMVIFMREIGQIIRLMDMGSIRKAMDKFIRDIGLMIYNMVLVKNVLHWMDPNIKENLQKEWKTAEEELISKMALIMKEIFLMILWMDRESVFGQMEENMKEIGWIIKCMEKEFLLGRMGLNMKENLRLIWNMEKGNL